MNMRKPIIIDQATLHWEGWRDTTLATKSAICWKLLITGERTESSGLVTGIAQLPPGAQLPLHYHEPEETYYVVSGRGEMKIDDHTMAVGARLRNLHPCQCQARAPMHRLGAAVLRVLLRAGPLRPDHVSLRSIVPAVLHR